MFYDIDDSHPKLKTIATVPGVRDVGGVCASADTGMFYLAHQNSSGGHVVALNLYDDQAVWDRAYQPGGRPAFLYARRTEDLCTQQRSIHRRLVDRRRPVTN